MIKHFDELEKILKALDQSGTINSCIICGSWATYFYQDIFENFIPPISTTDLDIFFPNPKMVKSSNFCQLLIENDYLRKDDSLTGKTTFLSARGLEIEFLTLPDRTMSNVINIKGINVKAECLGKMLPATWNYITVNYNNININIPSPASFVFQKLLINEQRSEEKKKKDIDAIRSIMSFIILSPKYSKEFSDLLNECPKKWKKAVLQTLEKNEITAPINVI